MIPLAPWGAVNGLARTCMAAAAFMRVNAIADQHARQRDLHVPNSSSRVCMLPNGVVHGMWIVTDHCGQDVRFVYELGRLRCVYGDRPRSERWYYAHVDIIGEHAVSGGRHANNEHVESYISCHDGAIYVNGRTACPPTQTPHISVWSTSAPEDTRIIHHPPCRKIEDIARFIHDNLEDIGTETTRETLASGVLRHAPSFLNGPWMASRWHESRVTIPRGWLRKHELADFDAAIA